MNQHYTAQEMEELARSRGLTPGMLLWSSDIPLTQDSVRGGGKNAPGSDYLRYEDLQIPGEAGRIDPDRAKELVVHDGQGISLFIAPLLRPSTVHLGTLGTAETPLKSDLKKQYPKFKERFWCKIEKGQQIPPGLKLVYDGRPPGHCTLTVDRSMSVEAFLSLVALVHFQSLGTDYYNEG